MMKILSACSLFTIAFCLPQIAFAQSVERPRPAGWDRIVPGGRFNITVPIWVLHGRAEFGMIQPQTR